MKTYPILLLCCLFVVAPAVPSLGTGVLHTFTTPDGRTLKASVLSYNAGNKKIQIEREDGKKIWILPSVFSEADRKYIQQWIAADQFMSPAKFRIKGDKSKKKISKEETKITFEITLENKTDFPLRDLRIEYRAFILKKILNTVDGSNPKDSNRVDGGQLLIAKIPAGRSVSETPQILLNTEFKAMVDVGYFNNNDYYDLKISTEQLEGFWIRVYGPEVDGIPSIREWCTPSKTIEKFAWQDLTPSRQTASSQKSKSDPAEEIERLTKTYERNPSPRTARNIGYAYMWSLKPPNIPLALEWYEKAAKKNNLAACRGLAGIYSSFYGHTQYYSLEKTIKYAQQALSIEPDGHTAHRMMAKAYAVDGQFNKAVEHQEKALEFLRPHKGKGSVDSHISAMEKTLELYKNKKTK